MDENDHAKMESSWGLNVPRPCSLRWVAIIDIIEASMASLVIDLFWDVQVRGRGSAGDGVPCDQHVSECKGWGMIRLQGE